MFSEREHMLGMNATILFNFLLSVHKMHTLQWLFFLHSSLSQATTIEDQVQRPECFTRPERKLDAWLVESEGETSKVEPY